MFQKGMIVLKKEAPELRSLENRGILLKGTTKKISSQEKVFIFFRLLISTGLPLMKNVLTPLVKSILILLGLTASASATDTAIQKMIFGSGATALIIANK